MLEAGFTVFVGFVLLYLKLSPQWKLRLLGRPLLVDFVVSAVALAIHGGTYVGAMSAAVAGLLTSLATSFGRRAIGFTVGSHYTPGWFFIRH